MSKLKSNNFNINLRNIVKLSVEQFNILRIQQKVKHYYLSSIDFVLKFQISYSKVYKFNNSVI